VTSGESAWTSTTEGFVWALGSLCRLHRIAFDPALVRRQFPPPYDLHRWCGPRRPAA
jgi:hypothetical protein